MFIALMDLMSIVGVSEYEPNRRPSRCIRDFFFHCCLNCISVVFSVNLLTPNDHYNGRTAPLTSKVSFYIFIQQI